jgi:hypothetical protein
MDHASPVDRGGDRGVTAADVNLIWYVGLDAEATTIGMRSGMTRVEQSARGASLASTGSPSATRNRAGQGARRTHLLILAMTPDRYCA